MPPTHAQCFLALNLDLTVCGADCLAPRDYILACCQEVTVPDQALYSFAGKVAS